MCGQGFSAASPAEPCAAVNQVNQGGSAFGTVCDVEPGVDRRQTGVVGFIAGFIVAKFCGGGSSCYAGGDGDCVEIYVGNLSYDMSEARDAQRVRDSAR